MVSNNYLGLFLLLCLFGFKSFAQTDSAAVEAIKMRNSLDSYLLQNVGDKPNTLKEKWMAAKIDSFNKVNQQLLVQNALLQSQLNGTITPPATNRNQKVYTVYFSSNSYEITAEGKDILRNIANQNPNASYLIKGYSDAYGNAQSNLSLSLNRASRVRSFFKALNPNVSAEIFAAETSQNALKSKAKLARKVEIIVQ